MGPHLFVVFSLSPHSYAQAGVCAAPPARWRRLLGTYVAISSAIVNVAAMLAVREPERLRACVRVRACVVRVCVRAYRQTSADG